MSATTGLNEHLTWRLGTFFFDLANLIAMDGQHGLFIAMDGQPNGDGLHSDGAMGCDVLLSPTAFAWTF